MVNDPPSLRRSTSTESLQDRSTERTDPPAQNQSPPPGSGILGVTQDTSFSILDDPEELPPLARNRVVAVSQNDESVHAAAHEAMSRRNRAAAIAAACSSTQTLSTGLYSLFTTVADSCYEIPFGVQASQRSPTPVSMFAYETAPIIWGRYASIFSITNNGTLFGHVDTWSGAYNVALLFPRSVEALFNTSTGIISGGTPILSTSNINLIDNSGLIEGQAFDGYGTAIRVRDNFGQIINRSGGVIREVTDVTASGSALQIYGQSPNGVVLNYGLMTVTGPGTYSPATIEVKDNFEYMTSTNIGSITNFSGGVIENNAGGHGIKIGGIYAPVHIDTITNAGTITPSAGAYGIYTPLSSIGTLSNAQGGNAPLTYWGALPGSYNIIVNSLTNYGKLAVTSPTGTMSFGIYGGTVNGVPASVLSAGTYTAVLSGVTTANISGLTASNTVTGTYGLYNWTLQREAGAPTIWDLIVVANGPDATNTTTALRQSGAAVQRVLDQRTSALALMTNYDCATFNVHNLCLAYQARYTSFDTMSEGAGVLTAAYRLNDHLRIGAFIDYRASETTPAKITTSNEQPTFGALVAYSQTGNNTGLQSKVVAAAQKDRARVKREGSVALNTEAGSGEADLTSYVVSGELGWGYAAASSFVATPYMGLRYTENERHSYSEETSSSVAYPVHYADYAHKQTTATAGVRLTGMMSDRSGYQLTAGVERDIHQSAGPYSGSSSINGLSTFALSLDGVSHRTRANGQLALFYQVDQAKRLTSNISFRNQTYASQSVVSVMTGYQVAF